MTNALALYILKDAQVMGDLSFSKPIVTLGSSPNCDFCLEDGGFAPLQAQFILQEGKWFLYEIQASGVGVFINGQKLESQNKEIFSGDEVTLGSYRILVRILEEQVKAPPPQTFQAPASQVSPPPVVPPVPPVPPTPPPIPPSTAPVSPTPPSQFPPPPPPFQETAFSSSPPSSSPPNLAKAPLSPYQEEKTPESPSPSLKQLMEKFPSSKGGVLQMLVLWNGTVVDTYHCSQKETFYIGSGKNSGHVSGLVDENAFFNSFPLISVSRSNVRVNFPFNMEVELFSSQQYLSFKELSQQGRVRSLQGGYGFDLVQGDIFYISLNQGLQILFRYVPQTIRVILNRSLQMSFREFAALALSFVLVSCLALYIHIKSPQAGMEEEDIKEAKLIRRAQFVYKKVEPIPEPPRRPTPPKKKIKKKVKKVQLVQKRKRNIVKLKKSSVPKKKKKKKQPNVGSTKRGGSVKISKTQGANAGLKKKPIGGLLSAFGGGGLRKNLDKEYSGSGQILGMASHATGKVGFNKDRPGEGLGSSLPQLKSLKGESSEGINTKIRKGKWSRGKVFSSGGGTTQKGNVELDISDFGSDGKGNIDRDAILRVVRRNRHELRFCYERELIKRPDLQGKVLVHWQINPYGKVMNEKIVSSSFPKGALEKCILLRLRSWRFPVGAVVAEADGGLPSYRNALFFFKPSKEE